MNNPEADLTSEVSGKRRCRLERHPCPTGKKLVSSFNGGLKISTFCNRCSYARNKIKLCDTTSVSRKPFYKPVLRHPNLSCIFPLRVLVVFPRPLLLALGFPLPSA